MKVEKGKPSKKKRYLWGAVALLLLTGLWQLVMSYYVDEEKELRSQFRATVTAQFPELAQEFSRNMGLFPYEKDATDRGDKESAGETVILVHGLDDPGKVWMSLAPALAAAGYDVWLMHYPNDQPIVESARFFKEELGRQAQLGMGPLSIVCHSMGGLVSREMLTNPQLNYIALSREKKMPLVKRLIMVGTPNHGSQMARFRVFGEFRDQLEHLLQGQGNGLSFIFDGAGEAKLDLLPKSTFLTRLNGRSHPEDVDMLVIAGISTPWNEEDISSWVEAMDKRTGDSNSAQIEAVGEVMTSMTHGLGDGLVTLESATLAGVPLISVSGTHLSMIRNIRQKSERIPPAVPIIVKELNKR